MEMNDKNEKKPEGLPLAPISPNAADQVWAEKAKTESGRREIIERLIDSGANIITREMTPRFIWLDIEALQDLIGIVHHAYVETVTVYPDEVFQILPPIHILHYDGTQILNTLKREEFIAAFKRARSVERVRIFFNLQRQSSSLQAVEVNLEEWGGNQEDYFKKSTNKIVAQSKNRVWVSDVINRVSEVLSRSYTKYQIFHSKPAELLFQLSGVSLGLILSVRLAKSLAQGSTTETRLYFFVFFILLFSNIWTHILGWVDQLRQKYLPIVRIATTGAPSGVAITLASSIIVGVVGSVIYEGLRLLVEWLTR